MLTITSWTETSSLAPPAPRLAAVEQGRDRERRDQTAVVAGLVTAQGDRRPVHVAGTDGHLVHETAAVGEGQFSGRCGGPRAGKAVGSDGCDDQVVWRLDGRLPVCDQDRGARRAASPNVSRSPSSSRSRTIPRLLVLQ